MQLGPSASVQIVSSQQSDEVTYNCSETLTVHRRHPEYVTELGFSAFLIPYLTLNNSSPHRTSYTDTSAVATKFGAPGKAHTCPVHRSREHPPILAQECTQWPFPHPAPPPNEPLMGFSCALPQLGTSYWCPFTLVPGVVAPLHTLPPCYSTDWRKALLA